jgi:hypothetical protein
LWRSYREFAHGASGVAQGGHIDREIPETDNARFQGDLRTERCERKLSSGRHAKAKRRAGSSLISLLLDIEQPLRDATHTVEALRRVGHGLSIHDNAGGDAVAELARIAAERLQVVEDTWNKVLEARRRQKS